MGVEVGSGPVIEPDCSVQNSMAMASISSETAFT